MEVTHRGMHRFIPRHKDEIAIETGDPIHVFRLDDDLWCEGDGLTVDLLGRFPFNRQNRYRPHCHCCRSWQARRRLAILVTSISIVELAGDVFYSQGSFLLSLKLFKVDLDRSLM